MNAGWQVNQPQAGDACRPTSDKYQAEIAAGRVQAAINTLSALLNQLQAQAGKHISSSCKDGNGNAFNPDAVLIADVKAILGSLGVNVAADPIMGSVVNSSGVGISGLTVNLLNSTRVVLRRRRLTLPVSSTSQ